MDVSDETGTPETPPTLTDEQRAQMEEWLRAHPYGEQDENGIDLSAIRRNLRLTPGERLARLQQAVNSLREVKDAIARH
jgi:hypothetical protein